MPGDNNLTDRVRKIMRRRKNVSERRMFGGTAFMADGNMACAVRDEELYVRIGNEAAARALAEEPNTRPMDITGRPMKSYVVVEAAGLRGDRMLRDWVSRGVQYARSLPLK